jgi:hypothetical protein
MATIDIKRSTSTILSPLIDDNSKLTRQLNGEDYIQLSFKHDSFVEILVGDYIEWRSQVYTINQAPGFKKISNREYQYDLRFEGPQYALERALFLLDGEGEFFLTGLSEDFVDLIVENLNRVYGPGSYAKGTVELTQSFFKNLQFNNENCLEVLKRVCEEFELEYSFTDTTTINLVQEIGNASGLSFEYHAGLRNIRRNKVSDKDIITRLYVFGSEKNIDYNYGSKRLKMPSAEYPNGYIEMNTSIYGIREGVYIFEDIYPEFDGDVTNTAANNKVIDSGISPEFDINNYLIEGETAKIVFRTGDLAGYEFDIISYNHSTKEVTFKPYTDESGLVLPSDDFKPAIGNRFTFVDITMPTAYTYAAESYMAQVAADLLADLSAPNVQYEIDTDWHHLRATSTSLDVGDIITITDPQLTDGNLDFRVLELTQSIANEYKYTVKIGESILVGYLKKVITERAKIKRDIVTTQKEFTRNYRRGDQLTEELQDAIFDQDGYFDPENIKPLSIETAMLTVGSKSTQLVLRDVVAEPNYQGNANQLRISAGYLTHFTIESAPKTWTIASNYTPTLSTGDAYYLYAKCNKSTTSAVWLASTTQWTVDPEDGYYYFLVGFISTAVDDVRALAWLYSQTTINGGFIRTGRIESLDGTFWVDLDSGEAELGRATLRSNDNGQRIVIDSSDNTLKFYNAAGNLVIDIDDDIYNDTPGIGIYGGLIHLTDGSSYNWIDKDYQNLYKVGSGTADYGLFVNSVYVKEYGETAGDHTAIVGWAASNSASATAAYVGLKGYASAQNSWLTVGVDGSAYSATSNKGLNGYAYGGTNAYGVYGEAAGATNRYGGYFKTASGGTINRAIYSDGNVQLDNLPSKTDETYILWCDADGNLAIGSPP